MMDCLGVPELLGPILLLPVPGHTAPKFWDKIRRDNNNIKRQKQKILSHSQFIQWQLDLRKISEMEGEMSLRN